MKWVLLAIGILAVVAVVGMGIVGLSTTNYYCTPPIGHITPMLCKIPLPPGMPLPVHSNYHY